MSEYKFKNLNEISTVAEPAEGTTMMGFENGVPIQMPMGAVKSGGGVFIIDPTSADYKPTDTTYGDAVKDALLTGKVVWAYAGGTYMSLNKFHVGSNCGQAVLNLWSGTSDERSISLYISDVE